MSRMPAEMKVELVPLDQLVLDPANANTHPEKNLEAIKGSFGLFDQYMPLGVDAGNVVRVGNGRLEAMRALGYTHAHVVRLDRFSPAELIALGITDNRTGQLAEFDMEVLARHLGGLQAEGLELGPLGW